MSAVLPWGESLDELAKAVLADKDAPLVLVLAAWMHVHGYDSTKLRSLVDDAVALSATEGKAS